MSANIFVLTIENEAPREFNSAEEYKAVLHPRMRANTKLEYTLKEIGFCADCGEQKKYSFMYYCEDCSFRNNLSVKASRKIIRSAKRHGNPVVSVDDGGDIITGNEKTLLEAVHSVDFSRLNFQSGHQVSIVSGNESESDSVPDYHTALEDIVTSANLNEEPQD